MTRVRHTVLHWITGQRRPWEPTTSFQVGRTETCELPLWGFRQPVCTSRFTPQITCLKKKKSQTQVLAPLIPSIILQRWGKCAELQTWWLNTFFTPCKRSGVGAPQISVQDNYCEAFRALMRRALRADAPCGVQIWRASGKYSLWWIAALRREFWPQVCRKRKKALKASLTQVWCVPCCEHTDTSDFMSFLKARRLEIKTSGDLNSINKCSDISQYVVTYQVKPCPHISYSCLMLLKRVQPRSKMWFWCSATGEESFSVFGSGLKVE